jgi:hypothetical protein
MSAVLNIVLGPIPLSCQIVSPVEKRIEGLEDQCPVFFFFRLVHNPQNCDGRGKRQPARRCLLIVDVVSSPTAAAGRK